MPFLNFYSTRPAVKILITFLAIVSIGLIVFFVGLLLGRLFFWMHLSEVDNVLYGRYELISNAQLKYFQALQTVGFFIIPGIFLQWIFSHDKQPYFQLSRKPRIISTFLVLLIFVASIPFVNWVVEFNQNISFPDFLNKFEASLKVSDTKLTQLTDRILSTQNFGHFLINILVIAILPAIGEELIFRGVLQRLFSEIWKNIHISVIIVALIFSLVHGQFYGLLPRFLLGLLFGYLMVWSKNIWVPIIAHFINNAIAVSVSFFMGAENTSDTVYKVINTDGLVVWVSVLVTGILIFGLKRLELKRQYDV